MPAYEFEGITPVVDPTAFVHPTAVLIGEQKQAIIYTEKAGVNSVIIDSLDDLRAVTGNIAFSLSLYSGQMCTTSQNIFIPKNGVQTADGNKSADEVAEAIVKAVTWLLGDPKRGSEILGAIQSENTLKRIDQAKSDGGEVLNDSVPVENEMFPDAKARAASSIL